MISKILKILFYLLFSFFEYLFISITTFFFFIVFYSKIDPPNVELYPLPKRVTVSENHYKIGRNWLRKNKFGFWEMYVEGDDFERGVNYGVLAKELVQKQEKIFVNQINTFVPSESWQQVLRLMIGFFNKNLIYNIPKENLKEIYGVSLSFSDKYDYIGTKYQRILNYHAAHDIGHALNNYNMVGCTSFGVRGKKTNDSNLLIGRNFDFYVGDDFAKEKILLFIKPKKGIPFASYSWAGFTGVASGLNLKGISVTINASKSDLPTSTKTPISILAREILQYASTLQEAVEIAKKRQVFVSETIMVSSGEENKIVLIEKSPKKMGVYYQSRDIIVCSNHYQSDVYKNDNTNIDNIKNSDSKYRFERVNELLNAKKRLNENDVIEILRNQTGKNNDSLGMGNPVAINQLIAHHSVVFKPKNRLMYVTSTDFQLGKFVGYNLNEVFKSDDFTNKIISEDPFMYSDDYKKFKFYKAIKSLILANTLLGKKLFLTKEQISKYIKSNSESYIVYESLGNYFLNKNQKMIAKRYFLKALTKILPSNDVKNSLVLMIKKCEKQ